MPNKILTFEDFIVTHELQEFEEETNSYFQSRIKDLGEKKTMSSKEGSIINDTRKTVHSEGEQNTILESEEEISEVIEEETETESIRALTEMSHTSINDLSFRTNSSSGEIMNQLSDHSANKEIEKQIPSKEQNISSEKCNVSNRSLSLQLVCIKSKEAASDNDVTYSSSVKSEFKNNILSTACGSDPLTFQSSSPLDSQESRFLRSDSIKTDMKPLENAGYCSIGIQTECDMLSNPVSHPKIMIQHSCPSQPVMHSDTGEPHSLQETIPLYTYYSRTMEFPG